MLVIIMSEIEVDEIIKKITKEVIKDEIYDDGEINGLQKGYGFEIHNQILVCRPRPKCR